MIELHLGLLRAGDGKVNRAQGVHRVLLDVAKADLAFRLALEVRNRLTEAYQEIMRMQM